MKIIFQFRYIYSSLKKKKKNLQAEAELHPIVSRIFTGFIKSNDFIKL